MTDIKTHTPAKAGFNYLLRVRYSECDAQQVVFNARYGDYLDLANTEYFRVLIGGFQTLLAHGLDTQVVSMNINWQASALFDQVLCLKVSVTHIGNTSFALRVDITDAVTHKPLAQGDITYVVVDIEKYEKAAIPDWFRGSLTTGTDDLIVNHAGTY
jgi:acyl-CoA thioester hydrolase